MDKMTDSRAAEVLDRLALGADEPDVHAALAHAIDRLREPAEAQAQGGGEVDRWDVPPCIECGAVDAKDAETKCICAGDKDDCHGCHLWPDGDTAPPSAPVGVEAKHVETLRRVIGLLRDTASLQGREHITLGIAFTDAIDHFHALAQQPAAVDADKVFHALSAYVSPADRSYFRKALEAALAAQPGGAE